MPLERIKVKRYTTDHWGDHIFLAQIDWDNIDNYEKGYLSVIGEVGVDSASVTAEICITVGDLVPEVSVHSVFTPEGDGGYKVLVGRLEGIGKCLIVAFDLDQPEDEEM